MAAARENDVVTVLSRSSRSQRMLSIQCDVCCPPALATNDVEVLAATGWRMRERGADLDVCPLCVRDRRWVSEPPRVARFREQGPSGGRIPNLFVIGAAKCGTTSLHAYLDTHPEVFMAALKELRFFQDPGWEDWLPWYRAQFLSPAKVLGESSTMYTRSPALPGVAERIAATAPDARLIYLVRDPIDRAVASYLEERFQLLDPRPIEEAFADLEDPYHPYVAASRYAEQLRVYLEHFPAEQLLVIPLSDLEQRPGATLERVFGFLDVDPTHVVDTSRRLNEAAAKYQYGGFTSRLRRGIPGRVVQRIPPRGRAAVQALARGTLSRPLERPGLTDQLRDRLAAALAPDAREFRQLTGLELPDWSV